MVWLGKAPMSVVLAPSRPATLLPLEMCGQSCSQLALLHEVMLVSPH